jgi:hypothetical protein
VAKGGFKSCAPQVAVAARHLVAAILANTHTLRGCGDIEQEKCAVDNGRKI